MIKQQFVLDGINVTVKRFESPFKNDYRLMETYIFEREGKTVKTTVERLNASMHEVAKILLKSNINLI